MRHCNRLPPLILLALSSLTSADALIFTGHGEIAGPPFPTSSNALEVRRDDGTPLAGLYVSLPSASEDSAVDVSVASGGLIAHFDSSKLEPYEFPGAYSQRFDGVDPAGNHGQSTVLSQVFTSDSFEALVRLDLSPGSPEEHLYYTLRGQIAPDQPITFSNVYLVASPQGFFDLNLSFSDPSQVSDAPVIHLDLSGSTTALPEPSIPSAVALAALLAASRPSRYHRRPHG